MVTHDERRRELRDLEQALRDLLAILASVPGEPWSWHFEPLLDWTVSLQTGDFSQQDLTDLSSRVTSYFTPKDAGFNGWSANVVVDGLDAVAARVASAARALRFIGDV